MSQTSTDTSVETDTATGSDETAGSLANQTQTNSNLMKVDLYEVDNEFFYDDTDDGDRDGDDNNIMAIPMVTVMVITTATMHYI